MNFVDKELHLFLKKLPIREEAVVCGFSGGADSTALTHALRLKADFFGFSMKAVTFSHGDNPIGGDENRFLDFCSDFCSKFEIPHEIVKLDFKKTKRQGWESSGRAARLDYYEKTGARFVFLGHHKDDQDESSMIHLMRGGGRAACGMKNMEGRYCRPFLNLSKLDLEEYLNKAGISWVEDETNSDVNLSRNFWRRVGLPTISSHYPHYRQQLANLRNNLSELHSLSDELAVIDGLDALLKGDSVSVSGLSESRMKNLLSHFLSSVGKPAENGFCEQQAAHWKANGNLRFERDGISVFVNEGVMASKIAIPTPSKPKI